MTESSGGSGFSLRSLVNQSTNNFSGIAFALFLMVAISCAAQSGPQSGNAPGPDQQARTQNPAPDESPITIPAGTNMALVLTQPVDSKSTRRGDLISAQTSSPIIVNNQVVIPVGTFIQGKVDKLARRGSRGEMVMQSASVIYPNGYVASLSGPLKVLSDEGTAWNNPSSAAKAGALTALLAGPGIGAGIGAAQHTTQSSTLGGTTLTASSPKGVAIGTLVGLAAGGAIALVLLARSHSFYVQEGSPLQMSLPQSVTIAQQQANSAGPPSSAPVEPAAKAAPRSMPASSNHGTCYIPGSPGTPPTVIPGSPPMGDSPGTSATYIPGVPPTPAIPYPCP
jgi:hypothetical protein